VIFGIGTDLCEIARIQRVLDRYGDRFARKILVESEMTRFLHHRKPAAYLAKRFAAKEAFSKAMGSGIRFPVNWQNVSVENGHSGKPMLLFSAPLDKLLRARGVTAAHLSLTDETGMACAFVVLEGQ
jgi:holo-[acyl-carrier protein] synthase